MALSNTKPASNSLLFLYPYEKPQTDLGDLHLYNFGSFRSNREVISLFWHTTQQLAQEQKSYLKGWYSQLGMTPLISSEMTKVRENAILVSMDITSLYTNIPQKREYIRYARRTTHLLSLHIYVLDKRSGCYRRTRSSFVSDRYLIKFTSCSYSYSGVLDLECT